MKTLQLGTATVVIGAIGLCWWIGRDNPASGYQSPAGGSAPGPVGPPPLAGGGPGLPGSSSPVPGMGGMGMQPGSSAPRFHFQIDPKTPLRDLLPTPPKVQAGAPRLIDDLAQAPEIAFQEPMPRKNPKNLEETAHMIAKINHVNRKKTDAFMEALIAQRADLSGLPYSLGGACRLKAERGREFVQALGRLRQCLGVGITIPVGEIQQAPQRAAATFWTQYQSAVAAEDQGVDPAEAARQDEKVQARIAAMMQVLAPEPTPMRLGLVKHLAGVSHVEATKALAKLAIFSAEEEIRRAAVDALKVRRERDYTDLLLQGLRYPLPAVAQRAAEALVKLERRDLAGELVSLLDEPDPRAPVMKEVGNKPAPVARELVKINHHRNCVLCHAPGLAAAATAMIVEDGGTPQAISGPGTPAAFVQPGGTPPVAPPPGGGTVFLVAADPIMAQVPIPDEPLPTPSQGYGSSIPDILVRIDVTYLRQDFSMLEKVPDAHPWPEMQRFDFLVRNRVLTAKESQALKDELNRREQAGQRPYRQAVLVALRALTGREAEPNAPAWRRVLKLPAQGEE